MYIDLDNIVRQIEIAQQTLDSINYIGLTETFNNVSRIYEENRRILETWNNINEKMFKNIEINISNIAQIAKLYNSALKNINPTLLNTSNYNTIIDTTKIFDQIKINIANNDIGMIIEDLNSYNNYFDSGIDDFSEIEDTLHNDPIRTKNLINDAINSSLLKLDKERKLIFLGTFLSLLLLIRSNGGLPEETIVYLDFFICGIVSVLMQAIYDKSK